MTFVTVKWFSRHWNEKKNGGFVVGFYGCPSSRSMLMFHCKSIQI